MEIKIREVIKEDKRKLINLSLGLTAFNHKYNEQNRVIKETLENRLQKREAKVLKLLDQYWHEDSQIILIATLRGKPVGYALAYIFDRVDGYLDEMFVDEDARGMGIGKMLLNGIGEFLKEKGVKKLKLNVFLWNENAIKLYEAEGFKGYFMCYIKDL